MQLEESRQITEVQKRFVNFYNKETINPYISLAADGPWIITTCGAVLHDSGGYGMLGFGHNPEFSKKVFNDSNYVMANIMTANFVQKEFSDLLFKELGHTRLGTNKETFTRVVCLNSGSESVSLALRLADLQTSLQINKKK